jgi:hypothetical protein
MICAKEINRAENVFVPVGGSESKGRAASVIRLRNSLVVLGTLRKGSNGLLPGRIGGVRLGSPYG